MHRKVMTKMQSLEEELLNIKVYQDLQNYLEEKEKNNEPLTNTQKKSLKAMGVLAKIIMVYCIITMTVLVIYILYIIISSYIG